MENSRSEAKEAAQNQHRRSVETLYGLTKTICNGRPRQIEAVLDKNGNLVSGKEEEQKRWQNTLRKYLTEKNQQM